MDKLSEDLQNKILFPKYYKVDNNLTLNEKIHISNCLSKISFINQQIKCLIKEFDYQKKRSCYNVWRNSKHPNYYYILYKSLEKRDRDIKNPQKKYCNCKYIKNNKCIKNNVLKNII